MSTTQLVKNGEPNSDATRHIAVKSFFLSVTNKDLTAICRVASEFGCPFLTR